MKMETTARVEIIVLTLIIRGVSCQHTSDVQHQEGGVSSESQERLELWRREVQTLNGDLKHDLDAFLQRVSSASSGELETVNCTETVAT